MLTMSQALDILAKDVDMAIVLTIVLAVILLYWVIRKFK